MQDHRVRACTPACMQACLSAHTAAAPSCSPDRLLKLQEPGPTQAGTRTGVHHGPVGARERHVEVGAPVAHVLRPVVDAVAVRAAERDHHRAQRGGPAQRPRDAVTSMGVCRVSGHVEARLIMLPPAPSGQASGLMACMQQAHPGTFQPTRSACASAIGRRARGMLTSLRSRTGPSPRHRPPPPG